MVGNLRIADLGAWRGKSYRVGRGVNVGFSQYEPMIAHQQRMSANRPLMSNDAKGSKHV
jgi:hypothetical protein